MNQLIKYLWGAFLFTFPLSIRWVFYEPSSYRFGQFNPWVTGFVYLPEILLGIVFLLWFVQKFRTKDYGLRTKYGWLWVLFGLFMVNAFVVTFLFGDSFLGALFVLRVFEALIVFWLLVDKVLEARQVVTILLFGALLQIVWGIAQFHTNGSLGLSLFGEAQIGPDVLGVAKNDLPDGTKQVRAYGSFLHPNIFAAYLLTIFFLSLRYLKYGSKLFWFAIFLIGVYVTNSHGAFLAGLAGLGVYFGFTLFKSMSFRRSVVLTFILLLTVGNYWFYRNSHAVTVRDASIQERTVQNTISRAMWKEQPFGVGVRNFTLYIEDHSPSDSKFLPWEFQPVHNAYFLILNEVGIQGLIMLLLFFLALFDLYWKAGRAVPLLMLMLLATFDHFLWDSWVGIILLGLVAGFFVLENHREGIVDKVEHFVHHDEG